MAQALNALRQPSRWCFEANAAAHDGRTRISGPSALVRGRGVPHTVRDIRGALAMKDDDAFILIFDSDTGNMLGHCSGPCACGGCPSIPVGESAPVSCAGKRLLLTRGTGTRTGSTQIVPEGTMSVCPLAKLMRSHAAVTGLRTDPTI